MLESKYKPIKIDHSTKDILKAINIRTNYATEVVKHSIAEKLLADGKIDEQTYCEILRLDISFVEEK